MRLVPQYGHLLEQALHSCTVPERGPTIDRGAATVPQTLQPVAAANAHKERRNA